MNTFADKRLWWRSAFFALFILAPPLDVFRLDLTLGHFIVFGQDWTLGLEPFLHGEAGALAAAGNLFLRGFLPVALLLGLVLWVSWKYGRLYCGWLCPHFSVVEMINLRASGKPTLWESKPLPSRQADGSLLRPNRRYWFAVVPTVLGFALLWSVTLLTYLLPPQEIYHNLWQLSLTRNQSWFLGVASALFTVEFFLARHWFCRFGCAVGLLQSFLWMANRRALVVGFDAERASLCASCNAACDNACPMRLRPRTIKRMKLACTQCTQCLQACSQVQAENPEGPLLHWLQGDCARHVSERDFGQRPVISQRCFVLKPEMAKNNS